MALTTEDGTLVPDADSYVTLVDADAYFAIDAVFAPVWDALEDAEKEAYLKWATRLLDQKVVWNGRRVDRDSSLRWPRTGVYDRDRQLVDDNVIPLQLQEVTFEVAKYLIAGNDPTTSLDAEYIRKLKADVVEIEYQEGTLQPSGPPPFINSLLAGLGRWPGVGNSFFVRIRKA
jgi:hypothetical protein